MIQSEFTLVLFELLPERLVVFWLDKVDQTLIRAGR